MEICTSINTTLPSLQVYEFLTHSTEDKKDTTRNSQHRHSDAVTHPSSKPNNIEKQKNVYQSTYNIQPGFPLVKQFY